jgi:hypothetical protein
LKILSIRKVLQTLLILPTKLDLTAGLDRRRTLNNLPMRAGSAICAKRQIDARSYQIYSVAKLSWPDPSQNTESSQYVYRPIVPPQPP